VKKQGFTLIELLIVVAIIGILAAIAIPNFLQAQTRAKVSKAQSELRVLATAAEAYYVDNNAYPRRTVVAPTGYPTGDFTTPIAYLKSTDLRDPFNDTEKLLPGNPKWDQILYSWHPWRHYGVPVYNFYSPYYGKYRILSYGPDRDYYNLTGSTSNLTAAMIYDPTNGTTTAGNIILSQKYNLNTPPIY